MGLSLSLYYIALGSSDEGERPVASDRKGQIESIYYRIPFVSGRAPGSSKWCGSPSRFSIFKKRRERERERITYTVYREQNRKKEKRSLE